ncbi:MAG: PGPGW domain-containing protein [Actinomycetota bacterium]
MKDRREIWGDHSEEREADETIAEFAQDEEVQRKWHDHPTVIPFKVVVRFIKRSGKRIAVTIAGFAVLLAGIAMLVLPGPGWVAIFAGLAILATEYVWARRLLNFAKKKVGEAKDAVLRKKSEESGPES